MAYGMILGQKPIIPENPNTIATNVSYNNSTTSSIITGTNVQAAIDQLFTSVSNGKSLIASAITDKGVSTSSTASFRTMANNIKKIQSATQAVGTLIKVLPLRYNNNQLSAAIPSGALYCTCDNLQFKGDGYIYSSVICFLSQIIIAAPVAGNINIGTIGKQVLCGYSAYVTLINANNNSLILSSNSFNSNASPSVSFYK